MVIARSGRIEWIDVAKGIGILLVVLGHISIQSITGVDIGYPIFAFHMPFFIILSALVFREEPWSFVALKRARSILMPYAFYLIALGFPICVYHSQRGLIQDLPISPA